MCLVGANQRSRKISRKRAVISWRAFVVGDSSFAYGPNLQAITMRTPWDVGENKFQCLRETPRMRTHKSPRLDCTCGFYGVKNPIALATAGYTSFIGAGKKNIVWAKIEQWGTVIEGDDGYRSSRAEIKGVFVRPDIEENTLELLKKRYDVPFKIVASINRDRPNLGLLFE